MAEKKFEPGTLFVVATPIGNLEDMTFRALRVLREVDLIAAEDTRRTRQLLSHYQIHKPLISYHEHNRRSREDVLVGNLHEGRSIALVTDAGTPGISDPGEYLVRRVIAENIPLVSVPGPSAFLSGLSVSGLSTTSFLFYGFLPSRAAAREKLLLALKDRAETLVFYESPNRLRAFLEAAFTLLGDRRAMVAREMTKKHEEIYRGRISEIATALGEGPVRGEVTVVIEGCNEPAKSNHTDSVAERLQFFSRELGLSLKEAVSRAAEELDMPRREVYRMALKLKEEAPDEPGSG